MTDPRPEDAPGGQDALRSRILAAATALLNREGRDALTTRTVAAAAGVQAPTLYRLFGDKQGLLDAAAQHGFETYLRDKENRDTAAPGTDPADELRAGWDLQVGFGLSHPAIYALMASAPGPGQPSPAEVAGREHLRRKIRALARAGRLRVSEERAALLFHAGCRGLVLTLLSLPPAERDPELSALARESALAGILTAGVPAANPGPVAAAVQLRAHLPQTTRLSPGERALMDEWLARLAATPQSSGPEDAPA
ncbi:TetR/AcrR family transcriptional regulator [Deinococcus sp. Leaf326]|uniref:TetR/AcrR family transcriptional regulator n=1 Tax=Deinococcus sp. Leaf326 TaxID=1736338 RepID=UPI0006F984F0|nr:TetR/AcrR family transcriptional regulator [Deinococcus sp. Leaf326]KQR31797.1 TetR family transcriptional regulator [Deinococcus sp. Leaf326]